MISSRRLALTSLAAAGAYAMLPGAGQALAQPAATLSWRHHPAGPSGFFRAPVLLSDASDAILIDGGWTLSDGRALAEAIRATGRRLRMIYVSQSDPDFYFSLSPIKAAFPEARVVAAPETLAAIRANVQSKLATWSPQLRENGPQTLADIVMPEALDAPALELGAERIEIVPAAGLQNRRYLWAPSLKAVFGGVLLFNRVHVWTADTQTREARAAWVATLDAIAARDPAIVVAGHMTPDAPVDAAAIRYTRDYLLAFEEELGRTADSAALIAAMQARYPGLGMGIALEIGAKVAKGEMRWG
ncbi:MBL fold metallo-hydrolase [Plastoroseomonas hellenica]|uniref:MBL fold metallo-hydrolase n=1 Tax=Plastoroseomonas hellenica TaxID=2687306 RepID=UPI001BA74D71|nr:MBL fold metallo-hydrolase [Plastoroseomonas hellenica]